MKARRKTKNLTKMPINRAILFMALPAMGSLFVESLYQIVDTYWIGKLGSVALASVSATSYLLWFLFSLGDVGGIAANTLVSQAVGADKESLVKERVRQCLAATTILSILMALIIYPFRFHIFTLLDLAPDVIEGANDYLVPWLSGLPIIFTVMPIAATFRASGDPITPIWIMALMVLFNAVFDPLFIFGFGPIPPLGLSGAAWVSVVCHLFGVSLAAFILYRRGIWISWRGFHTLTVPLKSLWRVLKIGMPFALNGAFFAGTYIGLTWILAQFGTIAIAAIGMGHRIEGFPWFMSYGFSLAAGALAGQYLGARKPDEAQKVVVRTSMIAFVGILLFNMMIFLFVEEIIRFFITDAAVIAESAIYLKIVAVCWIIGVFEIVLQGAFTGSGNTLPPMIIGVLFTGLRLPAAYLFGVVLGFGTIGVWVTIGGSMVLKGIVIALLFKKGSWKSYALKRLDKEEKEQASDAPASTQRLPKV